MGQLLRIILILVALWLILRFVKRLLRGGGPSGGRAAPGQPGDPMVRCAQCGVFLPQSEAVRKGSTYFCSREHAGAAKDD